MAAALRYSHNPSPPSRTALPGPCQARCAMHARLNLPGHFLLVPSRESWGLEIYSRKPQGATRKWQCWARGVADGVAVGWRRN